MTNGTLSPLAQAAIAALEQLAEDELPVVLQWLEKKIEATVGASAPTQPAPGAPTPGPVDPPPNPEPSEDPTKP